MVLFSNQQRTFFQRSSDTSTGTILRTPTTDSASTTTATGSISNANENASRGLSPRVNPSILRTLSTDRADLLLPVTHNHTERAPQTPRRAAPRTTMRAAESGTGHLLPVKSSPTSVIRHSPPQRMKRQTPARSKSSGPSLSVGLPRIRQDLGSKHPPNFNGSSSKIVGRLRHRAGNASSEEDSSKQSGRRDFKTPDAGNNHPNDAYISGRGSSSSPENRRQPKSSVVSVSSMGSMSVSSAGSVGTINSRNSGSRDPPANPLRWAREILKGITGIKVGHLLKILIVFAVVVLVFESQQKALMATQSLKQFRDQESILPFHLQRIKGQLNLLHESLDRLTQVRGPNPKPKPESNNGGDELIREQIKNHNKDLEKKKEEVETLRKHIQLGARKHIIQEFGEGPVQVVLELDFGEAKQHKLSILLSNDTPHAAWTWLEQIGNNLWDGAKFQWQPQSRAIIEAFPPRDEVESEPYGNIQFSEHSRFAHQKWTIGVREQSANINGSGHTSMGVYINLGDNSQIHKHETCIGKIIDGLDILERKIQEASKDNAITIHKATAMHYIPKRESIEKER